MAARRATVEKKEELLREAERTAESTNPSGILWMISATATRRTIRKIIFLL
jgi:hypothetical protein